MSTFLSAFFLAALGFASEPQTNSVAYARANALHSRDCSVQLMHSPRLGDRHHLWILPPEVWWMDGLPATAARLEPPRSADYEARIFENGYELHREFPRLQGMEEAELYKELLSLGLPIMSIALGPDEKWYSLREDQPKDLTVRFVEQVNIPDSFSRYLKARMQYLANLTKLAGGDYSFVPKVEIRVGPQELVERVFHADGDSIGAHISLAETLNRSGETQGTYVVGIGGNVFELKAGESLAFASEGFLWTPPGLHSPPPRDGARIFLRYTGPVLRPNRITYVNAEGVAWKAGR